MFVSRRLAHGYPDYKAHAEGWLKTVAGWGKGCVALTPVDD
jgi:hypothetical protein